MSVHTFGMCMLLSFQQEAGVGYCRVVILFYLPVLTVVLEIVNHLLGVMLYELQFIDLPLAQHLVEDLFVVKTLQFHVVIVL